ncbi:hypothetical protein EDB86DRAFT_2839163 [Lactarius hatsudake]|nr:hypothetical protein EDB86DRAFT_2839163 [Lactarius hatsudake]
MSEICRGVVGGQGREICCGTRTVLSGTGLGGRGSGCQGTLVVVWDRWVTGQWLSVLVLSRSTCYAQGSRRSVFLCEFNESLGLSFDRNWKDRRAGFNVQWTGLSRGATQLREVLYGVSGSGTMRDNNEEGLAPLTTGLERDCLAALRGVNWTVDFLATLREVTVTVTTVVGLYTRGRRWSQSYVTITRIVRQGWARVCATSTMFTVQGTLPCARARVWGTGPGAD